MSTDTYTAEVEYSQPDGEAATRTVTQSNTTPGTVKDEAVSRVPTAPTIHRVGVWSGGPDERPEGGHEEGLLE